MGPDTASAVGVPSKQPQASPRRGLDQNPNNQGDGMRGRTGKEHVRHHGGDDGVQCQCNQ
eukprot:5539152-Karenia_brevis.AAC.1